MLDVLIFRRALRAFLGWLDTRTEAPIMKRRVNLGSDKYFRRAALTKGESEFDEILGGRTPVDGDDDYGIPAERSQREWLEEDYAKARKIVLGSGILLPVATVYLLGFAGLGPLGRALARLGSRKPEAIIATGFVFAVCAFQLVRMSIRAVRLKRELNSRAGSAKLKNDLSQREE